MRDEEKTASYSSLIPHPSSLPSRARDVDGVGRVLRDESAARAGVLRHDDGSAGRRLVLDAQAYERRDGDALKRRVPVGLYVAGDGGRVGEEDGSSVGRERGGEYVARVSSVEQVKSSRRSRAGGVAPLEGRALRESRRRDDYQQRAPSSRRAVAEPSERGRGEDEEEDGHGREVEHVERLVRERGGDD